MSKTKTRTQSKGRDKAGAARSAARKKKGPKHPNKEGFSNKSVDDDDGGELTNGTNVTDEEQKMLARLKHDNAIREERNKYKEAERQKFWIHRPIVNGLTILHVLLAIIVYIVGYIGQPVLVRIRQKVIQSLDQPDKMTCSNTCRELITSALCHSKCISVDRLAENIKGMRSCSMDNDIVDSSLDDKEQWDERKRNCFAALDLGTLVCPRDVSVGEEGVISEGGLNIARDLFECLRPSAFASFTSQCVGLLKEMKC